MDTLFMGSTQMCTMNFFDKQLQIIKLFLITTSPLKSDHHVVTNVMKIKTYETIIVNAQMVLIKHMTSNSRLNINMGDVCKP